jgi:N-methylhydantoinase B/oxoprolinase/acetone carboxylase alpha subunit
MNACNDPHIVNAALMSAEVAEQANPVYWQQYGLRADSGGPGKYRGGVGMIFKFKPLEFMRLSMETSWTKIGVPGVMGGGRGMIQYVLKENEDGSFQTMMGRDLQNDTADTWHQSLQPDMEWEKGSTFVLLTGGGGGYGDPLERPEEKVRQDVLDDYVSIEGAKRDYGVILNPDILEVDQEATVKLRKELSRSKEYREYLDGPRKDHLPLNEIIYNKNS